MLCVSRDSFGFSSCHDNIIPDITDTMWSSGGKWF